MSTTCQSANHDDGRDYSDAVLWTCERCGVVVCSGCEGTDGPEPARACDDCWAAAQPTPER